MFAQRYADTLMRGCHNDVFLFFCHADIAMSPASRQR